MTVRAMVTAICMFLQVTGRVVSGRVGPNAVNLSIFDQMLVLAVIPAKAGIQGFQAFLDPGFRRGDVLGMEFSLS